MFNVIKKDLKVIISDRQAVAILVLMPIILMTILSFALANSFSTGTAVEKFEIGVVKNFDKQSMEDIIKDLVGPIGMQNGMSVANLDLDRLIFEDILKSEDIESLFTYRLVSEEEGRRLLDDGTITNLVIFDETFLSTLYKKLILLTDTSIEVKVISLPDSSIKTQIVEAVFEGIFSELNSIISTKDTYLEIAQEDLGFDAYFDIEQIMTAISSGDNQIKFEVDDNLLEGRKTINSRAYYAIAMLSMFILFTGGAGGRMMLEEYEQYTLQRINMSGIRNSFILVGKFVTIVITGFIQTTIMVLFTTLVLKVDWGDYLNLIIINTIAIFSVASMGILIASITLKMGDYKVANLMENFLFQVMAFLGGSFIPLEVLPKIFNSISYFTINGLTLKAHMLNMQGYGIDEFKNYLFILFGISVVFTILAFIIINSERGWKLVKYRMAKNQEA